MHQRGFTLIELIMVIILLGILATTAAPRMLDLRSDARRATLAAMEGAVESATSMVHAFAMVRNLQNKTGHSLILPNGNSVIMDYGYPDHDWDTAWINLLEGDFSVKGSGGACDTGSEWCVDESFSISADFPTVAGRSGAVVFWPKNTNTADNCYVFYAYNTSKGNQPTIGRIDTGC